MEIISNYISSTDPSIKTLPTAVYVIWWVTLIIVALIIVPVTIALLHKTLRATIAIKRYLSEMLAAGVVIADNTSSIPALKETISIGGDMLGTAEKLKEHTGALAEVLSSRAKGSTL